MHREREWRKKREHRRIKSREGKTQNTRRKKPGLRKKMRKVKRAFGEQNQNEELSGTWFNMEGKKKRSPEYFPDTKGVRKEGRSLWGGGGKE